MTSGTEAVDYLASRGTRLWCLGVVSNYLYGRGQHGDDLPYILSTTITILVMPAAVELLPC